MHEAIGRSDLSIFPNKIGFNEGLALVRFAVADHGILSIISSLVPAKDFLTDCTIRFQTNDMQDLAFKLDSLSKHTELSSKLAANTEDFRNNIHDA